MYSAAYTAALQFKPDAAVVMLGTNDADPEASLSRNALSRDLEQLIKSLLSSPTQPQVWVAMPPPIHNENSGLSAMILEKDVLPAIKQAAATLSLPTIDVYSALGRSRFFFDGVHPNGEGAEVIAETVNRVIAKDINESFS